ncbi:LysR substrate-binding domain-containing protein [Mesorhizobium sp. 1B3]|uniref:LysR substrate-binding domain-containing protein n=1 Tax=Mesorhizobium sp. 1B3 TaxID=3243599 RepID=UPI003D9582BC
MRAEKPSGRAGNRAMDVDSGNAGRVRRESGITLSALQTFVTAVEAGSFSKVAAEFGVSQPTISIQLNNLEQACGILLLHRRPKIVPTEAGRELFIRARQILSKIGEFEDVARDLRVLGRGQLSVGTSTPAFAMPLVAEFMAAQPAVRLKISIGNTTALLEDVSQCRIDVGVMTLAQPPAGLHATQIARQRLVVCVAADDPWATRDSIHIPALSERTVLMREETSMTRQLAEAAFQEAGVAPANRVEIGSREAVREAVVAGVGVGILLEGELRGDKRLADVPLAGTSLMGGVYAVALKEAVEIPAVGAFLAHAAATTPPTSG